MAEASSLIMRFSTQGVEGVKGDMRSLDQSQKNLQDNTNKSTGLMRGMFSTAGGMVAATAFNAIAGSIGGVVGGLINANAQTEMINTQLLFVTGSAEKAAKVYDEISRLAILSPFSEVDFGESSVQLQAFGVDAVKWLQTIGDVSAVTGKTMFQTTSAVTDAINGQYRRLIEFGINTIQENGMLTFEYMNKQGELIRTSIDETDRALRESTLQAIMNDQYGGAMKEFADTWVGQVSTLKDNIRARMRNATSGIFGELREVLRFMNNIFAVGWRQALTDAMGSTAVGIVDGFLTVIRGIGDVAGKAIGQVIDFASGIATLVGDLKDAFDAGEGVKKIVQDLPDVFQDAATAALTIADSIGDIWRAVFGEGNADITKEVKVIVKAAFELVTSLPGDIFQWIQEQLFGSGKEKIEMGPGGDFAGARATGEIDGGLLGVRFGLAGARWSDIDWGGVTKDLLSAALGFLGGTPEFGPGTGQVGGSHMTVGALSLETDLGDLTWGEAVDWGSFGKSLIDDALGSLKEFFTLNEEQSAEAGQIGNDVGAAITAAVIKGIAEGANAGGGPGGGGGDGGGGGGPGLGNEDLQGFDFIVRQTLEGISGTIDKAMTDWLGEPSDVPGKISQKLEELFVDPFTSGGGQQDFVDRVGKIGGFIRDLFDSPIADIEAFADQLTTWGGSVLDAAGTAVSTAWRELIDFFTPDFSGWDVPSMPDWFTNTTDWLDTPVNTVVNAIGWAEQEIKDAWRSLQFWKDNPDWTPPEFPNLPKFGSGVAIDLEIPINWSVAQPTAEDLKIEASFLIPVHKLIHDQFGELTGVAQGFLPRFQAPIRTAMSNAGLAVGDFGRDMDQTGRDVQRALIDLARDSGQSMGEFQRSFGQAMQEAQQSTGRFLTGVRTTFAQLPAALAGPVQAGVAQMNANFGTGVATMIAVASAVPERIRGAFAGLNNTMLNIGFNAGVSLAAGMVLAIPWIDAAANAWRNAMIPDPISRNNPFTSSAGAGMGLRLAPASAGVRGGAVNHYDLRGSIIGADLDQYIQNQVRSGSGKLIQSGITRRNLGEVGS